MIRWAPIRGFISWAASPLMDQVSRRASGQREFWTYRSTWTTISYSHSIAQMPWWSFSLRRWSCSHLRRLIAVQEPLDWKFLWPMTMLAWYYSELCWGARLLRPQRYCGPLTMSYRGTWVSVSWVFSIESNCCYRNRLPSGKESSFRSQDSGTEVYHQGAKLQSKRVASLAQAGTSAEKGMCIGQWASSLAVLEMGIRSYSYSGDYVQLAYNVDRLVIASLLLYQNKLLL